MKEEGGAKIAITNNNRLKNVLVLIVWLFVYNICVLYTVLALADFVRLLDMALTQKEVERGKLHFWNGVWAFLSLFPFPTVTWLLYDMYTLSTRICHPPAVGYIYIHLYKSGKALVSVYNYFKSLSILSISLMGSSTI